MRRIEQVMRFLADGDAVGWSFARAALRPWRHRQPFQVSLGHYGAMTVRGNDSDIGTLRSVFVSREYAVPAAAHARLVARMNAIADAGGVPVIIDAGANIGAATAWFHHHFPRAHIIAVEPDAGNFAMLRRNCAGRPRIEAVEAAIGSTPGNVVIESHGASDAVRTVRSGGEGVESGGVPVMTVGQLVARVPGAVPFIAKIDIEGFEADLFARDTDWIDRFDALMIEIHDWMLPGQRSSATVQREMGRRENYELFLNGENLIWVRLDEDGQGHGFPGNDGT